MVDSFGNYKVAHYGSVALSETNYELNLGEFSTESEAFVRDAFGRGQGDFTGIFETFDQQDRATMNCTGQSGGARAGWYARTVDKG